MNKQTKKKTSSSIHSNKTVYRVLRKHSLALILNYHLEEAKLESLPQHLKGPEFNLFSS